MNAPGLETIAERIKRATEGARACNYDGGAFTDRNGNYVPPTDGAGARKVAERRNRAGRCTLAEYAYADGSRLRFTWSDHNGPRVVTFKPGAGAVL